MKHISPRGARLRAADKDPSHRKPRRALALILAISMMLMLMPALTLSALAEPSNLTFTVGNAVKNAGEDVLIPITFSNNNNSINAIMVRVVFDSQRLEWQDLGAYSLINPATHPWTLGGSMPFLMDTPPGVLNVDSVTFGFMRPMGVAETEGTLITLRLRVKDNAPGGDAAVALEFTTVSDSRGALNASQYNNIPGSVSITCIHTEGEGIVTTPAECEVPGVRTYSCIICNEVLRAEAIPAPGHDMPDVWTVSTPAACGVDGVEFRLCTLCGFEETQAIAALDYCEEGCDWCNSGVTFTITFVANGGTGTMPIFSVKDGGSFIIPANAFTRSNHNFVNWNTHPNAAGISYPANGEISIVTEPITLYAQWARNTLGIGPGPIIIPSW